MAVSTFFTCSLEQWANREIGGQIPKAWTRKRRRRQQTLASAIKEARKAGVTQARITVDGATVEFGEQRNAPESNEWDVLQ
jgi:hypothetical protein